jgi:hypothetical protein
MPLALGLVALAVSAVWLWRGGVGSARVWADTATILLFLPILIIGMLGLVVVAAAAYAVGWLTGFLPGYTRIVQRFMAHAEGQLTRASDLAVMPVAVPRSAWAAARAGGAALVDFIRGKGLLDGD